MRYDVWLKKNQCLKCCCGHETLTRRFHIERFKDLRIKHFLALLKKCEMDVAINNPINNPQNLKFIVQFQRCSF